LSSLQLPLSPCVLTLSQQKTALTEMNHLKQPRNVNQERRFITTNVGDSLTLECFHDSDAAKYYWYKQTLGQKLQLISNTYKFDKNGTFYDEFKDNPRFTLETDVGINHLKISNVQITDTATYFCASGLSFVFEFGEGTKVNVKNSGLSIKALIQQSVSETIQPGGSVTLNCTVHTGTCDGEHSVYWFKTTEESHHPGLIYAHGGGNDQCKGKSSTQTNTCVYSLPVKSLNRSHAGTYYCAVASCGHILFGNGTKLDFHDVDSPHLVYILGGALIFSMILTGFLAFLIYKINGRNCCQHKGKGYRDADSLHYAALSVNQTNRSRRLKDNTSSECVYSSVKQ
uniref:Ig-like domain-containing protein n=1 Tax=Amphilophus citrinellus TaxID=61819 RepID=A0A3Q0S7M6_AMPCI